MAATSWVPGRRPPISGATAPVTDAVRAACEYGIATWKLVRIVGLVFPFNPSSARVLEKCGFEYEGLLRKNAQKMGRYYDCRAYALVR